ncbi:hypothetical protein H4R34_000091 [Dimargaris verticillata]|uniref:Peptidase S8/S53 domain-containing protein n=1 Tax=Dimargaris verticillata TaxID=2761393 RepID=A0A9W8EFP5_9FUNG|nr:hypothetical protein H4R34_000091 [Dimargaris verticillata]
MGAEGTDEYYSMFKQSMDDANIPFTLEKTYSRGISAISVAMDPNYQRFVDDMDIVDFIQPNQVLTLQSVGSAGVVMDSDGLPPLPFLAHDFTGLNDALQTTNVTGKGIRIGVVDSGIDYRHKAFGSCYKTPGCRVAYGYDFVGDNFDGKSAPQPDDDPLDTCNYHGTAVAGIIAGDEYPYRGVAPEAELGIYRVMSCQGVLYDRYILDAVTMAIDDGMDIINLSLGSNQGFCWTVLSKFAYNVGLENKIIIAAVGNMGAEYMYMVFSPSVAQSTFAIGSYELPYNYDMALKLHMNSGNWTIPRSSPQIGAPEVQLTETELALGVDSAGQNTGCAPFTQDLTGQVVLLVRGGCAVQDKAVNAETAGAVAAIVYDSIDEPLSQYQFEDPNHIPTIMVTRFHGMVLVDELSKGRIMVSCNSNPAIFEHSAPYTVSPFSSWGPGTNLENKPDLLAPGSRLYVPVPEVFGSYGIVTGTSFSAAYVSGCAALMAETKEVNARTIMHDLASNATLATNPDGSIVSVAQQGRGMLDVANMFSTSPLFIQNEYLGQYGLDMFTYEGSDGPIGSAIVFNRATEPKDYYLRHIPAMSVTNYDQHGSLIKAPRTSSISADLEFLLNGDTVGADNTSPAAFTVNINRFNRTELWACSGYVEISDTPDGPTLDRIPYTALAGSAFNIPLLAPSNSNARTCLTRGRDQTCLSTASANSFTMTGIDYPSIRYRLQYSSLAIYFTVLTTSKGKTNEYLINQGDPRGVVRNGLDGNAFYTALWDGYAYMTYDDLQVVRMPAGVYQFRVRVCGVIQYCTPKSEDTLFTIWKSEPFTITGGDASPKPTKPRPTKPNPTNPTPTKTRRKPKPTFAPL